jgi:hypothetical protein
MRREKTGGGGCDLVRATVARSRVAGLSGGRLANNFRTHITEAPLAYYPNSQMSCLGIK